MFLVYCTLSKISSLFVKIFIVFFSLWITFIKIKLLPLFRVVVL